MRSLLLTSVLMLSGALYAFETDYTKALEQGRQDERPLLLFFNGSDWSGHGMKMKNEILTHSKFEEKIGDQLICVEIDFPKHSALSEVQEEQNKALKERFCVHEFPALVLIDPSEREIARLGYQPESGDQLAHDLLNLVGEDRKLTDKLTKIDHLGVADLKEGYAIAQDLQRFDAADQLLQAGMRSEDPAFFLLEKYRLLLSNGEHEPETIEIRNKLFRLDPNNEQGLLFTLALIDFQTRSCWENTLTPEEIIRPLQDYLTHFGEQDKANVWRLEMMIAQFYLEHDQWRSALQHAETAFQAAPEEKRADVDHSLQYIKEQVNQTVCN